MRRRAVARVALACWTCALGVACNAIIGNHDRTLQEEDAAETSIPVDDDGGVDGAAPETSSVDTGTDTGTDGPQPVVIDVPISVAAFTSPNGALFRAADGGGVEIYGTVEAGHAMITPKTQPNIPSDDYTLELVARAPSNSEFGLMMRFQSNGSGLLMGSTFGASNIPFLGSMGPPDWSPLNNGQGQKVTYVPNGRYHLKTQAKGASIQGKMWVEPSAEPDGPTVVDNEPSFAKGRGVGFYIYLGNDTVLEKLIVTVP